MYGCEIWGTDGMHSGGEKCRMKYFKSILGLPTCAPNAAVMQDIGMFSLSVDVKCRALKYWKKILAGSENSILKDALFEQKVMGDDGVDSWGSGIKNILIEIGLVGAWGNQTLCWKRDF